MCVLVDCSPVPDAGLSCENDILTVTWSTDVVFNATVSQIPGDLQQRLTERSHNISGYQAMSMIIINRQPP